MHDEAALREKARWAPQPKQELVLSRPEFEIGFGGARGGGKSDAGGAWLGYDSDHPQLRGAVIRKNSVDLDGFLLRLRQIHPLVKIYGNPPVIKFPDRKGEISRDRATGELLGGATYFTGHLKDKNALNKWVGQNLQRVLIEELNLVPSEDQYTSLLASVRSPIPGVKAQVFSTFNPDNVGHTWIKKRFNLRGIPSDPVITRDPRTGRMRVFVPSRVEDNQAIMVNDPDYVRTLEGLPDGLREQWRWGSWDDPVIRGAYFTAELAQLRHEGRICDLPVHKQIPVHTWWDIGADTTAIWFVQFVGDWIHLIDFYMNDSLGFPFYISKLQEFRENRGYIYGRHHFPHDFNKLEWGTGRNRIEQAEAAGLEYEIVPRTQVKQDSIDQARLLFPVLKIDQHRCAQGIDALINYRKRFNEEFQAFSDEPVHDWASHGADAFQGIAITNHDAIKPDHAPSQEAAMERAEEAARKSPNRKSREFAGPGEIQTPTRFHHKG
jgi:hypothetical protein